MYQTGLDNIDLQIIRLLARDSRTPYRNIASAVGITPSAAKERINKMVSNGVIQNFIVLINPVIFGYEKLCILIVKNIDKMIKEQDIFKKVSLLGDIFGISKHLEGDAILILYVRNLAQNKVGILIDLLKPVTLEALFATYRPVTMKILSSDLEIMKCLLSDSRMLSNDIAKKTSLSPKTVARRLEKMRENHILEFSIVQNVSSMRLTGYIEFAVLIDVKISSHQNIVERIQYELQEYLLHLPDWYQRGVIFAVFFCANISTVNLILRRLESYDGVTKVESYVVTDLTIYQDLLKSEIDKRIISQKYLSLSSTAAAETTTNHV
ncbi:MAG TPA: winged helix-turn-helix transcriptional regulator [Nitrososphaeraceae archaeon]|nr:winged helix-turn-helix transcriptional regulator [Nitrososphaeraceae archaeon]